MRDLLGPGMKPLGLALGPWSLNHWTRKVPRESMLMEYITLDIKMGV